MYFCKYIICYSCQCMAMYSTLFGIVFIYSFSIVIDNIVLFLYGILLLSVHSKAQ